MPRHEKRDQLDAADCQRVTVVKQAIKLRSVAGELRSLVENLSEDALDGDDLLTDRQLSAELFLKVWRRRQVVGVRVGL